MSNHKSLGRRVPTLWTHVERYALRDIPAPLATPVPVVAGVNWYPEFDDPYDAAGNPWRAGKRPVGGHWWVGRGDLGRRPRGGHAFCLVPQGWSEPSGWWSWFDQISEGICVSEAWARCMGLLNRRRYQPLPCYDYAQANDEYNDTPPAEGTSVDAGGKFVRDKGMVRAARGERHMVVGKCKYYDSPSLNDGIQAVRWATSIDEVLDALGAPNADYVDFFNSWGTSYPHKTRMPATTLGRLLSEYGEMAIPTDR